MSECASWRVKCYCQMTWLLSFNKFKEVFGESEENGHIRALRVYHRVSQKCVVHLEDKCVSVYQKKSLVHIGKLNPKGMKSFVLCQKILIYRFKY